MLFKKHSTEHHPPKYIGIIKLTWNTILVQLEKLTKLASTIKAGHGEKYDEMILRPCALMIVPTMSLEIEVA